MVHDRRERKGIAILVVISALMIITVLVTEFRIRIAGSVHGRRCTNATGCRYWLARSGVNMHQLILLANKEISNNPQVKQGLRCSGWVAPSSSGTFRSCKA